MNEPTPMSTDDDEILKEFIGECREHLSTIEADLLLIEEGGAAIDVELVNKVFRAAHSIKGGSGFFGLDKVRDLAHRAETVLDLIRSKKIIPNAEVTNLLLTVFDKLRDMLNNVSESQSVDTSELLMSLETMAVSYLPTEQKASITTNIKLESPAQHFEVSLPQFDIDRAKRNGQAIYWIDLDLIHDVEKLGLNVLNLFNSIANAGEILDCVLDTVAVGDLDSAVITNRIPIKMVLATSLSVQNLAVLFVSLETSKIHLLHEKPVQQIETSPVIELTQTENVTVSPIADQAPVVKNETVISPTNSQEISANTSYTDESIRVSVHLLETLMNLAGELVLSRNQLRAAVVQNNHQLLGFVDQRINQITTELQDVIVD